MDIIDDTPVADRSDLETALDCPQQLAFDLSDPHKIPSHAMVVGTEAHEVISATIELYIRERPSPRDMREFMEMEVRSRRPDMVADVFEAMRPSLWSIIDLLDNLHPQDIIRFDGGRGPYSGQLARDVKCGGEVVRVTSELDLLTATRSKQMVDVTDWKSGWTPYGVEEIADSFQFGLHSTLIFENYPEVEEVRVRVLETRKNAFTHHVSFERKHIPLIDDQIQAAVGNWLYVRKHLASKPDQLHLPPVMHYPTQEKCGLCRHAVRCWPGMPGPLANATPEQLVDFATVMEQSLGHVQDLLKKHLKATGKAEIVGAGGLNKFGTNKPKQNRTTFALYGSTPLSSSRGSVGED